MISLQEAVRDEVTRVRSVPIVDLERWHPSIATVWVLTRNKKFVQAISNGTSDRTAFVSDQRSR
jgi:predicted ATPase